MDDKSVYRNRLDELCNPFLNSKHRPLQNLISILKSIGFEGKIKEHQIDDELYTYYETTKPIKLYVCWVQSSKLYMASNDPEWLPSHRSFWNLRDLVTYCITEKTQRLNPLIDFIIKCHLLITDVIARYREFGFTMAEWKTVSIDISHIDQVTRIVCDSKIFEISMGNKIYLETIANLRLLLEPHCNKEQMDKLIDILNTSTDTETASLEDTDDDDDGYY